MLASAANGRFDRDLELGAEGAVPWAHPPSLPGSPPAGVGGCALAPPRGTAAEAATDTAILACLRVIDAHLSSGAGLVSLAGRGAELFALLEEPTCPATLAGEGWMRLGVLALLAGTDVAQVTEAAHKALKLALEGGQISGQLSCLALLGVADALAGRVVRADVRLSDAVFLCAHGDATLPAQLVVRGAAGLVALMLGEPERAHAELATAASLADAAGQPEVLRVLLLGHRLYAAAALGREAESADFARSLGEACIPEGRHLLCAYRHLALGVLALRGGLGLRALERADACIEEAEAGGVGLLSALGTLLRVQALADLRRSPDAREVVKLASSGWLAAGLNRLAAVARIELAMLDARCGELDRARSGFAVARALVPVGETLRPLHRPRAWLDELEALLGGAGAQPRVRIQTLGELIVEIDGRRIYDRDWKGRRTRMLLIALICEGGQKVPATRLADMLWPDAEGDKALQNLKVALHRLRRLGCREGDEPVNWVHVKHGLVTLPRHLCRVDAHELEALGLPLTLTARAECDVVALSAFAGEFLPGESGPPWIVGYRRHLVARWEALAGVSMSS